MAKHTSSGLAKHAVQAHSLMGHHTATGMSKEHMGMVKAHALHGGASIVNLPGFVASPNPNSMTDPDAAQDAAEKATGIDADGDNDAGTGH